MRNHGNFSEEHDEQKAVTYSIAMEKARFGRYQYIVLTLCGLVMASISGPGSSLQENRPVITCDLMISHNQRMRIDMYTIIALILGGLAIAIPGDFVSRLKSLVVSLTFYGSCTMALGFCREYYCFTIFSVFKAFWASALLPVMMVYVAEVQTARCRGASLCFLQIFWLIGLVAMPVLSIGWRSSQFIFGTLALLVTVPTARYFTESPRFLLSLGREEDALKCLKKIYERNFPKSEKEYPVQKLTNDFSPEVRDAIELHTYIPKAMRPPWYCPIVVLQTGFVLQLCYFTMSYWFPEMQCRHVLLFRIMRRKLICKFGEKSLEDKYLPPRDIEADRKNASDFCNSINIDTDYYKEVSTISLVALTFLVWMILRVDYIGRTYFLTLSHVIAGSSSFLVHFVIGTKYRLFYTCLMGAMWVISSTMSSCLAIEFSKTRYRVFAVGLVNSFGYAGMAMGMYGLLLKGSAGCIAIISVTGILATAKGVMAGSVATLAVLWISLQGMGFVVQPSAMDASRVPISLQNYLSSYTGLPSLTYQPGELTMSTRSLLDRQTFPAVDEKAINSSVNFGHMIINRLARLEASITSAGVAFTNDTPTHGQYIDWYPTPTAHKKSVQALVGVKASAFLAQSNCHRYGLKRKSCAQFVSTLKLDGTDIGQKCAKDQELDCDSNSQYRTIDGTCNNLENPRWGSALTAYSRILFPNYADGIQEIRRPERRGKRLPSPRAVSLAVSMNDVQEIDSTKTLAVMQWAQFIAHDVSHTPVRKMVTNDQAISCCRPNGYFLLPRYTHPDCAAISIPDEDPIYGEERIRCMNYVRSMPAVRPDCSFGPVEQMNQVSHYLDGSTIYGSTLKTSRTLRTFANGFLRAEVRNGNKYLPTAILKPASLCNDNGCYMAGDFRVNFVPHLAIMHTIWHREHNRVAAELARLNPLWTDEILYQEARRILIAEIQHITYREWLPLILGTNKTSYGHVFPVNGDGSSQAYNNLDNPSISNEAATAAFRFMNSLVQGKLHVYNESRLVTASLKLHEHYNKAKVIEDAEVLDGLIRGLSTQLAKKMDSHIVSDMTNKMYKTIGKLGLDSISLDIQRGRDHGLPGYNEYRKFCGLPFAENFDELLDTIPIETVNKLHMVYNHPNDIDLVVGGMAERPNPGGLLGPTFSCIISEQFARMRRTDRFFYDSNSQPHPFTEDQLDALRNVSLARIFCDNGDTVASMQPHVFLKLQPGNELGPCDDYEAIPSVDLFAWAEKAKAYR